MGLCASKDRVLVERSAQIEDHSSSPRANEALHADTGRWDSKEQDTRSASPAHVSVANGGRTPEGPSSPGPRRSQQASLPSNPSVRVLNLEAAEASVGSSSHELLYRCTRPLPLGRFILATKAVHEKGRAHGVLQSDGTVLSPLEESLAATGATKKKREGEWSGTSGHVHLTAHKAVVAPSAVLTSPGRGLQRPTSYLSMRVPNATDPSESSETAAASGGKEPQLYVLRSFDPHSEEERVLRVTTAPGTHRGFTATGGALNAKTISLVGRVPDWMLQPDRELALLTHLCEHHVAFKEVVELEERVKDAGNEEDVTRMTREAREALAAAPLRELAIVPFLARSHPCFVDRSVAPQPSHVIVEARCAGHSVAFRAVPAAPSDEPNSEPLVFPQDLYPLFLSLEDVEVAVEGPVGEGEATSLRGPELPEMILRAAERIAIVRNESSSSHASQGQPACSLRLIPASESVDGFIQREARRSDERAAGNHADTPSNGYQPPTDPRAEEGGDPASSGAPAATLADEETHHIPADSLPVGPVLYRCSRRKLESRAVVATQEVVQVGLGDGVVLPPPSEGDNEQQQQQKADEEDEPGTKEARLGGYVYVTIEAIQSRDVPLPTKGTRVFVMRSFDPKSGEERALCVTTGSLANAQRYATRLGIACTTDDENELTNSDDSEPGYFLAGVPLVSLQGKVPAALLDHEREPALLAHLCEDLVAAREHVAREELAESGQSVAPLDATGSDPTSEKQLVLAPIVARARPYEVASDAEPRLASITPGTLVVEAQNEGDSVSFRLVVAVRRDEATFRAVPGVLTAPGFPLAIPVRPLKVPLGDLEAQLQHLPHSSGKSLSSGESMPLIILQSASRIRVAPWEEAGVQLELMPPPQEDDEGDDDG